MMIHRLLTVGLLSLSSACAATATYSHTAEQQFPARQSNCDVRVTTTLPDGVEWEEIGVVNVQIAQTQYGTLGPKTPDEFLTLIRKDVCKAGGEHVVGDVNGVGQYVRGTVFRKKGSEKR